MSKLISGYHESDIMKKNRSFDETADLSKLETAISMNDINFIVE